MAVDRYYSLGTLDGLLFQNFIPTQTVKSQGLNPYSMQNKFSIGWRSSYGKVLMFYGQ